MLTAEDADALELWRKKNGDVSEGNALLAEARPSEALERYDEAAKALPSEAGVHLNRGLALQRIGPDHIDQAMQAFKIATQGGQDPAVRARAHTGLGNAFFAKEDYDAAMENYRRSLLLSPGNRDVAWNLELARQKKKEKEEQQKKDQEQEQDQQNQEQDQQQDQEQDQQQDQEQDQQQDQEQDQQQEQEQDQQQEQEQEQDQQEQEQDQQEQEQDQQPEPQQATEQLLDALEQRQDDLRREMARRRALAAPQGATKDW